MKPDARAKRVALVADAYVNPPPGGFDGLAVVAGAGWGVIQLPADLYPAAIAGRMLAEVAEQVEEFARHDYTIVVVGAAVGLAGRVGEAEVGVARGIGSGLAAVSEANCAAEALVMVPRTAETTRRSVAAAGHKSFHCHGNRGSGRDGAPRSNRQSPPQPGGWLWSPRV